MPAPALRDRVNRDRTGELCLSSRRSPSPRSRSYAGKAPETASMRLGSDGVSLPLRLGSHSAQRRSQLRRPAEARPGVRAGTRRTFVERRVGPAAESTARPVRPSVGFAPTRLVVGMLHPRESPADARTTGASGVRRAKAFRVSPDRPASTALSICSCCAAAPALSRILGVGHRGTIAPATLCWVCPRTPRVER